MKRQRFEDWFSIQIAETDEENWPGRLVFDPDEGISLSTISFGSPEHWYGHPAFEGETLVGYLDYQRPTTLVRPRIRVYDPGMASRYTKVVRLKYEISIQGIIKNIHLEDIDGKYFNNLIVNLPAFHAYWMPELLQRDYVSEYQLSRPVVNISEPRSEKLELVGGIIAEISEYPSLSSKEDALTLSENTSLELRFPEAISYGELLRTAQALQIVFCFLIGTRLDFPVFESETTKTEEWNDIESPVVAEIWVARTWRSASAFPDRFSRMLTASNSSVGLGKLIECCLSNEMQSLRYLMGVVLFAEASDGSIDDLFIELLGALEQFDRERFGSGKDPEVRKAAREIRRLVNNGGSVEAKSLCEEIGKKYKNEYSLKQRLERLVALWHEDKFRGDPDLGKLVKLRNLKPHGLGHTLSEDQLRHMAHYKHFLCALARYHVLRVLGYNREGIAQSFVPVAHRYGVFVPLDLVPGNDGSGNKSKGS